MDERSFDDPLRLQLLTMVEGHLLGPERLRPWAESWVLRLERPPHWLLELCTARDSTEVLQALSAGFLPPEERTEALVACLLLRHRRGVLSWAALLRKVGQLLDAANGRRACEDIYALLTELERSPDAKALEPTQRVRLEHEFHDALERIESVQRLLTEEDRNRPQGAE